MHTTMIGLDIAKSVFQVHIEDGRGVRLEKRLRRGQVEDFFARQPASVIGLEACGTCHHWGRALRALGHEVRLIPAAHVKPFVKRNKTDAHDAEAICAAMQRPGMRSVAIKSLDQQASRGLERARDLLVRQRTQLANSVRAQFAEFGVIAAQGRRGFALLAERLNADDPGVPGSLATALRLLIAQIAALEDAIAKLEDMIMAAAKADPAMRRLTAIPGVGGLTAHAVVAAIGEGRQFRSAREAAAWCGLTPRQHASAGKRRSAGISRQGDERLRRLFALGAVTVMRSARSSAGRASPWQRGILARRPMKVAVIAQAAKTARIAFAMLRSGEPYRRPDTAAA